MNKPKFPKFFRSVQKILTDHGPEILTGVGIAGMVTTTILAVRATPKALKKIEQAKEEANVDKLTPIETVKAAWKPYIPAAITGVASACCLIGSTTTSVRRTAALATACQISERALVEYRDKVVETIGEKKEKDVLNKLDKEHVEQNPVSQNEVLMTKKGHTLCYDDMFGRYFESDIDLIHKAENELNARILSDPFGYASLNEFYDLLDLPSVGIGDMLGWNTQTRVKINIGSQIADDGRPCVVMRYSNPPFYKYDE